MHDDALECQLITMMMVAVIPFVPDWIRSIPGDKLRPTSQRESGRPLSLQLRPLALWRISLSNLPSPY